MARAYRAKGDTTRSVELLKQTISLDMYSRQAYVTLANTLSSQGKHKEAKELLEKCMTISPRYLEVYNILGLHYRRIKNYKTSIFYFEKSLAIQEKANTLRNYTITLFLNKDYEKALEIAQKAFIGSKSAYSYVVLGIAYLGVGNKEKYVENIRIAAKKKYAFENFADDMQFIRKDTAFIRAVKEGKALAKKGKLQEQEE
jgi:tetratricopeptide (TPR) repeat protein